MPSPADPDQELMHRLAEGDKAALAEVFDRHSAAVLGLLLRMVRRRAEAEELLQEVFFEVWQSAADYRPEVASPRTWILMRARSRAIDRLRSAGARRRREEDVVREARREGGRVEPPRGLERLESEERRLQVRAALAVLPEEQRAALELAFFEGLTHRQVAERLAAPLGTVKSRILLGMRKLRERLSAAPDEATEPR